MICASRTRPGGKLICGGVSGGMMDEPRVAFDGVTACSNQICRIEVIHLGMRATAVCFFATLFRRRYLSLSNIIHVAIVVS